MRRHPNNTYQVGDLVRLVPGRCPSSVSRLIESYYSCSLSGVVRSINGEGVQVRLDNGDCMWCRYYTIEHAEPEIEFSSDDLLFLVEV